MTPDVRHSRAVVIGATGFIGSHVAEQLVASGAEVLSIARSCHRQANVDIIRRTHRLEECDIQDTARLQRLLCSFRPEKVLLLACNPDGSETREHVDRCLQVNLLGTLHVYDAALSAGANRLVFADSVKVYGNSVAPARGETVEPMGSYAVSKAAAWQLLRLLGRDGPLEVVSVRSTFVYGPRQNWNLITYVMDCVHRNRPVRLQGGNQTRDPLYVSDAVNAFIHAAYIPDAAGHAIPVGGGQEIEVQEMCRMVLSAVGSDLPIELFAEPPRPTEIWRSFSDNSEAARLLRWVPTINFQAGLRQWLRAVQPGPAPLVFRAGAAPA